MLAERGAEEEGAQALAELQCRRARRRIAERFSSLFSNDDRATYSIAKRFLEGEFAWVEQGIVPLDGYRSFPQAATQDRGAVPDSVEEPVTA